MARSDRDHAPATRIASLRCTSYDVPKVREAVRRCVEALPELQARLGVADNVLLKPNLLSSTRTPDRHVNTHPSLVLALAELLIGEFGCRVAVGDSCGTLTQGSTALALRNSGIEEVCRQTGARLYNVDAQPRHVRRFERGVVYKNIPLPENLNGFDLIVSVSKLKTHSLTGVTGPVKNLFGLVPGAAKKRAHMLAPRADEFAALLCDLYDAIRPGAAFVDGIVGMEGQGPAGGALKRVGLVAASTDAVALDSFCAQVMGFDPMKVPLLAKCHARALGVAKPEGIWVEGEPAQAFAPDGFAKPPTHAARLALRAAPRWLSRVLLDAFTSRHADIDQTLCIRCGECARNCPSGAISLIEPAGTYGVDRRRCISCYCCAEACPADAIELRPRPVLRLLERIKRPFGRT
jgi:uncharacterized protein (DUF362 family)/ferredoxin